MPTIQLDHCTRCLKCVNDCPSDAIDIKTGTINNTCIHCGHCVAICPVSTVFPDHGDLNKLHPFPVSPAGFQQLSAGIRSCRSFLTREVDDDILKMLVDNMKHYPSASNARPVEITIVKTGEAIQKMNDLTARRLFNTIRIITSPLVKPLFKIFAPNIGISRIDNYRKRFIALQTPGSSLICHHAPAVMLFHAPVKKYGMGSEDANIWATYTSIFANTLGLGSCFNGFIVKAMERSKTLRKECMLPSGHRVYAALLIGYPKVKYTHEAGRDKPRSVFI